MGLNLQELKVSNSLDQLVQNNHTRPGEPHSAPHPTPLVKAYSSEEDLSPRLRLFSDTWTQHTIYLRQNIQHVRKKGIKQSFLKLHQPAQLPSSHSLPYKAVPALYHIPYSTKRFLSYFPLLKGLRSWILQRDLQRQRQSCVWVCVSWSQNKKAKACKCREAAVTLNHLGLLDIHHSDLSFLIFSPHKRLTGERNSLLRYHRWQGSKT